MKNKQNTNQDVLRLAKGVRHRVLGHVLKNNGGYLSQACSSAEILACLYARIMKLGAIENPIIPGKFSGVPAKGNTQYQRGDCYNGPKAKDLDRFILSPTHYSLVLYAVLVETRRMAPIGLDAFNQDGGIVEMIGAEHSPGMEVMTGSLGQGISQAAGIALARKLRKDTGRVWVFMSDGELQPGQVWEALSAMSFYKLDNMGIYVDVNGYQVDGKTCDVMNMEPLEKRFDGFGCRVFRVCGHDVNALVKPARLKPDGRPLVVLCDTKPWQGILPLKKRFPKFHYVRFTDKKERESFELVLEQMRKG
ncbi:MAG: 1-deoxy-D-xylulose-5-phosphate synthase N-terminal domain-containing protein [Candidatus Omnitrophota bacterium]